MAEELKSQRGETAAHAGLKRLALIWAQAHGYSICAIEVRLPQCRYRADIVAYRPEPKAAGSTAIFECKQALPDLRRDNGCSAELRARLQPDHRRRLLLEKHLRVHYPHLRVTNSLCAEFHSHNFAASEAYIHAEVLRDLNALQSRLSSGTMAQNVPSY